MLERLNDIRFIRQLTIKKAMQYLTNHARVKEWDRAVQWYSDKKSEVRARFTKAGNRLVNEEFIHDHVSGKTDDLSNALSML